MKIKEKLVKLKPFEPSEAGFKIKMDSNESFLTLPDEVIERALAEIKASRFNRYPDPKAVELRKKFAAYHGIDFETVIAGNGSDELIVLVLSTFLEKGDKLLITEPDFPMYEIYGKFFEYQIVKYQKEDYALDADELIELAKREKPDAIVFSSPCNPTSLAVPKDSARRLVQSVDCLVILDEAYMDFTDKSLIKEAAEFENLVILRTMSKAFACASIRLGFAATNRKLADILMGTKSPYNVSGVVQTIGEAVLADKEALAEGIELIKQSAASIYAGLSELKTVAGAAFRPLSPDGNFVCVLTEQADYIHEYLLKNSISVRNFGKFLRITASSPSDNATLLACLRELT
ncbi:MAG TPA: histidinol-phosphate transaminase [Eubacteriales bacterium]|nr:histidinol-phosphate transaminase [Eubacteriales bacterium]